MINPITNEPFTTADVDRILGLADQFLGDWESDAGGDKDEITRSAERRKEWDVLRPLLLKLPDLLALQTAVGMMAEQKMVFLTPDQFVILAELHRRTLP